MNHRENGFTIIELLITISIFSIVALAVYSSFAAGITVWKRERSMGRTALSARIFLEKITRDLRNSVPFSDLKFTGNREFVSFPGLVYELLEKSKENIYQVGMITYYYKSSEKSLYRHTQNYRGLTEESINRQGKKILSNLKNITFTYYIYNPETETYGWVGDWNEKGEEEEKDNKLEITGIRVEIKYNGMSGKEEKMLKTIYLPIRKISKIAAIRGQRAA